jgi:hypothetical protein
MTGVESNERYTSRVPEYFSGLGKTAADELCPLVFATPVDASFVDRTSGDCAVCTTESTSADGGAMVKDMI